VLGSDGLAQLSQSGGELRVSMAGEGPRVSILVEDDGPGFPAGFEAGSTNSLGYKLIDSLMKANGGSFEILPGPGGRVMVDLYRRRE